MERRLSQAGDEIYHVSEQAHEREKEVSVAEERRANASALIEKNRSDIEALKRRAASLHEQSGEAEKELVAQHEQLGGITETIKAAEDSQAVADRDLLAARTSREADNKRLVELEGKLSTDRAQKGSLHQQEEELAAHKESLSRQAAELRERRRKLQGELASLEADLGQQRLRKSEVENQQADLQSEMTALTLATEEMTTQAADLSASLEACEARRHLLEDMMLQYEGYQSGMVAVMEVRDRWPDVAGTVGEKFVPVEGLESAVEVALGDLARCLICRQRETAESIVEFLKSSGKGRIGILMPGTGTINPGVKRPEIDLPEFVGWLDSFVSTEEELRPLKEAVLARTAV
jgi:chromosome segregation ATPase